MTPEPARRGIAGKTVVITGANSGLGFEAARVLARRGATVVLACRNLDKGKVAAAAIHDESPGADVELLHLDLADLASIRDTAGQIRDRYPRLDVLVNNAGVMAVPKGMTADGFELQIGTNHLGHFALTGLVLESLLAADEPRVVTVSSGAHKAGRMSFDDPHSDRFYFRWTAYAQSKLANLLFAFELQRRSERAGAGLASLAAHPGWASTNLQAAAPKMRGGIRGAVGERVMELGNVLLAQSAEAGAGPIVAAVSSVNVAGGDYIGPDGLFEMRGAATKVKAGRAAYDVTSARRLWELSERLTGVAFDALEAGA